MTDYLTLGGTPCGESCAQVGEADYHTKARKEGRAYIAQLTRQFGTPPDGARFTMKSFPHDFGSYLEVAVVFHDDDEEAAQFAYRVESDLPENWDDQARIELGL